MKPLSAEEKAVSLEARKRANKSLNEYRKAIDAELQKLPISSQRRSPLLNQLEVAKDVKGLPAQLSVDGVQIVIDYEIFQRFIRKLKQRRWYVEIKSAPVSGSKTLVISHFNFNKSSSGVIELNELPQYQQDLLKDIPNI